MFANVGGVTSIEDPAERAAASSLNSSLASSHTIRVANAGVSISREDAAERAAASSLNSSLASSKRVFEPLSLDIFTCSEMESACQSSSLGGNLSDATDTSIGVSGDFRYWNHIFARTKDLVATFLGVTVNAGDSKSPKGREAAVSILCVASESLRMQLQMQSKAFSAIMQDHGVRCSALEEHLQEILGFQESLQVAPPLKGSEISKIPILGFDLYNPETQIISSGLLNEELGKIREQLSVLTAESTRASSARQESEDLAVKLGNEDHQLETFTWQDARLEEELRQTRAELEQIKRECSEMFSLLVIAQSQVGQEELLRTQMQELRNEREQLKCQLGLLEERCSQQDLVRTQLEELRNEHDQLKQQLASSEEMRINESRDHQIRSEQREQEQLQDLTKAKLQTDGCRLELQNLAKAHDEVVSKLATAERNLADERKSWQSSKEKAESSLTARAEEVKQVRAQQQRLTNELAEELMKVRQDSEAMQLDLQRKQEELMKVRQELAATQLDLQRKQAECDEAKRLLADTQQKRSRWSVEGLRKRLSNTRKSEVETFSSIG